MPLLRSALRDTRGAVAVEFALVSGMFLMTLLFVMFVGLLLYMGQALDWATSVAARQIMTGSVQKQAMSQSTFITSVVCPALPATFNCNNLIVNVQTLAEAAGPAGYYSFTNSNQTGLIVPTLSNASTQFNPGLQSNYVYLQIIYPITFLPTFFTNILGMSATYQGSPAYLAISTAAFRNEQF